MFDKDKMHCTNILEAASKIVTITAGFSNYPDLANSIVHFDAVLMNFIVIGEMSNKLSENFRKSHSQVAWAKIVSLRNFIAHDYFGIDAEEVWGIVVHDVPNLITDIKSILHPD